jgi:transcriptional regulator with XRE-family HTH domain
MAVEGGIGGRISAFRRPRGMSQERLAHLVGRSESWLSQVERHPAGREPGRPDAARRGALGQQRDIGAAVLHLLEAERIAPEKVRHHVLVRELVRSFLKRERRRLAVPQVRPLAERLGVAA